MDTFLRPLLADGRARRRRRERPLFNSRMFDGSSLPLEENLRVSSALLEDCTAAGVVLELECRVVGGEEDAVSAAGEPADRLDTTTDDLLRVAEVKINLDSDTQYALTRAVADHVLVNYSGVLRVDGGIGDKKAYDPRAWGARAETAMAARVVEACELFGSAGRSRTA